MSNVLTFEEAVKHVLTEIQYQDRKWGQDKAQSLPGFILIAEREMNEVKEGWNKNLQERNSALHEMVQVAAICIQAIMRYGPTGNTYSTNDIPDTYANPGNS